MSPEVPYVNKTKLKQNQHTPDSPNYQPIGLHHLKEVTSLWSEDFREVPSVINATLHPSQNLLGLKTFKSI